MTTLFERNEDRVTGFLKRTDFSQIPLNQNGWFFDLLGTLYESVSEIVSVNTFVDMYYCKNETKLCLSTKLC